MELDCGGGWDGDGDGTHDWIAVGGNKVCGLCAGPGSAFGVRTRELGDSRGMTGAK